MRVYASTLNVVTTAPVLLAQCASTYCGDRRTVCIIATLEMAVKWSTIGDLILKQVKT